MQDRQGDAGTGEGRDLREAVYGTLAPLLDTIARVHGWSDPDVDQDSLPHTVVEGIVAATGFAAGALSHVLADGSMRGIAVVGPEGAREALLGVTIPAGALEYDLAIAERWGRLRFIPAGTMPIDEPYLWVPDMPAPTEPDGWHPEDRLLAPLHSGSGRVIGVLSVDLPLSGRRPDVHQIRLLELLAGQLETALRNARRTQRLRASEESFRLAFESTAVGMALVQLDGCPVRVISANRALHRLADAVDQDPDAVLTGLLDAGQDWVRAVRNAPAGVHRTEAQLPGGPDRPWVQITATVLPLHTTEEGRAIVLVEDITERRRAQWDLEQRATRDPLTGLANRSVLDTCLADAVATARAGGPSGVLLFGDLDDFKSINDVFGHLAGDAVLRACGDRLRRLVGDRVFRLGGDEFAAVLRSATDLDAVVARIRRSIAAPVEHGGRLLRIGVSIGHCLIDGSTTEAHDLLALADASMYRDKRRTC